MDKKWISFFLAVAMSLLLHLYIQITTWGVFWANLITAVSIFGVMVFTFLFLVALYAILGKLSVNFKQIVLGILIGLVINWIWVGEANKTRKEEARAYLRSPYNGPDSSIFSLNVDTLRYLPMISTKLRVVRIISQELRSLPKDFGQMSNLKELTLVKTSKLDLEHLFDVIADLQLNRLCISTASIVNFPPTLSTVKTLKTLDLSFNKDLNLDSLFVLLSELPHLEELIIEGLNSSTLPPTISNLKQLKRLKLNGSNLEELPASMMEMDSLKALIIDKTPVVSTWTQYLDSTQVSFKVYGRPLQETQ